MRVVDFDPEGLSHADLKKWYEKWGIKATEATNAVVKAWEKWMKTDPRPKTFEYEDKFRQPIWTELKLWLAVNYFRGKCAYCESPLELDRYIGDAEHFRPKGRVTSKDEKGHKSIGRCKLPDGTVMDHPGYFWLAYHWRNLMPACSFCNTGRGKVDQFSLSANHFHVLLKKLSALERQALEEEFKEKLIESPAGSGWYFPTPRMLDTQEAPLLLNPLSPPPGRMPHEHLRYGVGGAVVAINHSPLAENSIRVYDLGRDTLRRRRQEAQETIRRLYYGTLQEGDIDARLEAALRPYREGEKDFSSAALDYVEVLQTLQLAATKKQLAATKKSRGLR